MAPPGDQGDGGGRLWRRLFTAAYLAFAALVVGWLFVSVAVGQCDSGGELPAGVRRISPRADDPREISRCRRDLERLLDDLHAERIDLQARALRYDTDPKAEWRYWSRGWRHRWRALDRRCRLSELRGTDINPIIDRMAAIHDDLSALERAVSESVARFANRDLRRMRRLKREIRELRVRIDGRGKASRDGTDAPPARERKEERDARRHR